MWVMRLAVRLQVPFSGESFDLFFLSLPLRSRTMFHSLRRLSRP